MRCKRKADQADYQEYIRKNRRTVDPFGGITDPVEITKIRHEPRKPDPLITYLPHATPPAELYAELTEPQLSRLMPAVLGGLVGGSGPARALWVMAAVLNVKKLDFVPLESAYDD